MSCIANSLDSDVKCDFDVICYLIKSNEKMDNKLKRGVPISFVVAEKKEWLFLIKIRKLKFSSLERMCKVWLVGIILI